MGVLIALVVIAVVIGLAVAAYEIHGQALSRYGYTPFNFGVCGGIFAAAFLFLLGGYLLPSDVTMDAFLASTLTFDFIPGTSNTLVSLLASLVGLGYTYYHVGKRTNAWMSAYCVTLMTVVAIIIIVIVILVAMSKAGEKKRR